MPTEQRMKILQSVTWEGEVFPCWRRTSNNAPRPNSDVWGPLPVGVCWSEAEIEEFDLAMLYLIGSSDLQQTFGSYRIRDIDRDISGSDGYNHRVRVQAISRSIRQGRFPEPPIVVSDSPVGPFVFIDGNHRVLAYHSENRLGGLRVYLGMSPNLLTSFPWARQAIGNR
jgi:hypothetical protein